MKRLVLLAVASAVLLNFLLYIFGLSNALVFWAITIVAALIAFNHKRILR